MASPPDGGVPRDGIPGGIHADNDSRHGALSGPGAGTTNM